jgi:hypothetical protein
MLRLTHARRDHPVDGTDGVTLTYARTGVFGLTSFGGGAFSYDRPVVVRHAGTGVVIPIRDHVMALRLAAVALPLAAVMWRWIDGR